jgi:hypothetical protein
VLGKALSAGVRGISQGIVVYAIALMLGVDMNWNPLALVAVIVLVILGASLFSTFSLIVACLVRTRERFMGIGQLMTMPLFFASSAIYPTSIMPGWLKTLAHQPAQLRSGRFADVDASRRHQQLRALRGLRGDYRRAHGSSGGRFSSVPPSGDIVTSVIVVSRVSKRIHQYPQFNWRPQRILETWNQQQFRVGLNAIQAVAAA